MRRDESPTAIMRRLRAKIQAECAEKAIDALTAVAEDPRAPAPARATAGTALLRAAGFFEKGDADNPDKEPHEMTRSELDAAIAELEDVAQQARAEHNGAADNCISGATDDVFD